MVVVVVVDVVVVVEVDVVVLIVVDDCIVVYLKGKKPKFPQVLFWATSSTASVPERKNKNKKNLNIVFLVIARQ